MNEHDDGIQDLDADQADAITGGRSTKQTGVLPGSAASPRQKAPRQKVKRKRKAGSTGASRMNSLRKAKKGS